MISPAISNINRIQILARIDGIHIPDYLQHHHVEDKTFFLDGPTHFVQQFLKNHPQVKHTVTHMPLDIWRREYKYLGDVHTLRPFHYDLRLREEGFSYAITSRLPKGCFFEDGFLWGRCHETTEIMDIEVIAIRGNVQHRAVYQIRFFHGINRSLSYTDAHYLRYGYGEQLVDYDPSQVYYRLFERSGRSVGTPLEEATIAARKIQLAAGNKKIYLLVSGGVDSQCMVQSFVHAQVPFEAVLMVDTDGVNSDDVFYANKYFAKLNLPLTQYPISFKDFIDSYKYLPMAHRYRFNNPEYGILLHPMDVFDGFHVYAGRPISVSHALSGEQVIGLAVDETWTRARYMERNRHPGCPEFLVHTPELMESFLQLPIARNHPRGAEWLYPQKVQLLRQAGFDVELAPPIKYTGFERLYDMYPSTEFGSELWLHHRGPLKMRYPNGPLRNAIRIENGRIGSAHPLLLKTYEDGFSNAYLAKNRLEDFH